MEKNLITDTKRETYIDALKGIAILGVIMVHSGASTLPGVFGEIGAAGAKGVQLFFLITAYLSCASLNRVTTDEKWSRKNWIWGRFLRIAPMYYLAILLYLICMGTGARYWLGNHAEVSVGNIVAHLLFINGFHPFYTNSILGVEWYIAVISIFYIIIAVCYKKMNSFSKASIWLTASFILFFLLKVLSHRITIGENDYIWRNYMDGYSIFPSFPVLMIGVVVFFLTNRESFRKTEEKKLLSYSIGILSIYFLFALITGSADIGGKYGVGINSETLFGVGFGGLFISQKLKSWKVIDNPFFCAVGKYSYGMFLFHMLFLFYYENYVPVSGDNVIINWAIKFLTVTIVSFLFSLLVQKYIAVPLERYGGRLVK